MPDDATVHCASYTHARRHPMVLGRIAGWAPPFQLTITQVVVVLATFVGLTWTWQLWAPVLPSTVSFMVAVGGPIAAAWAVRHVRVEGRSLARAALGYATLLSTAHAGQVGGRPYRTSRPARAASSVWIAAEVGP
jgi:hypothetical protein